MRPADPSAASPGRRALALLSLLATAALVVEVILFVAGNIVWLVVALVGLAVAVAGVWWVLTEHLPRRAIGFLGLVVGATLIVVAIVQALQGGQSSLLRIAVAAAALAVAALAGRAALAPDLHERDQLRERASRSPGASPCCCATPGRAAARSRSSVWPRWLPRWLSRRSSSTRVSTWPRLARDAIACGADCLGMAGGDGSQALVASIAHEHGIPFVCISAGTRNHFAQDLSFDKEDPRQGMAAFRDGVERFIDYATVGDRLFVNNVSLGIYATIVQQEGYRDAKRVTTSAMLPEMLSHQAEPFDLQFTTPDEVEIDNAFVIQVSNNPYVWGASPDFAQRRTMDSGKLGVFAVNARTGREAAAVVTRALTGLTRRDPYFHEFTAESFEVRSRGGKAYAGVDGEALELETPLEFRMHPRALACSCPPTSCLPRQGRRTRAFSPRRLIAIVLGRRPVPAGGEAHDAVATSGQQ